MPRLAGKKRVAEQLAELANPAPLDSEFRVARDDGLAAGSDSGHSESDNDEDWAAATSRSGPVGRNTNQQEPGFNEELKQMELAEQAIIQNMSRSAQSEIEKGRHVRTQLSLWDVLLDTRIRLQKVVSAANRLPPFGLLPAFLQKEESAAAVAGAKDELRGLFDCLRSLQEELVERNETLGFEGQRKRKRDENHNKIEGYLEGVWSDLQAFHEDFLAFRNDTLEKWSAKMMLASSTSGGTAKKLKVLDQSAVTQISHALRDRERLIKRTRLVRSQCLRLGMMKVGEDAEKEAQGRGRQQNNATTDEHLKNTDAEVFDDTDFYQQMLGELIERKMVDTDDPEAQGIRWASLQGKLASHGRGAAKQHRAGVDVRASKDRKLRYHVQEKLVGFMAPVHHHSTDDWHEERIDELFASLLGRRPQDAVSERKGLGMEEDGRQEGANVMMDGPKLFA